MLLCIQKNPVNFVIGRLEEQFCVDEKKKEETVMKALQKSKQIFIRLYIIGGNRYCSSHILCTGNDGMGK